MNLDKVKKIVKDNIETYKRVLDGIIVDRHVDLKRILDKQLNILNENIVKELDEN